MPACCITYDTYNSMCMYPEQTVTQSVHLDTERDIGLGNIDLRV